MSTEERMSRLERTNRNLRWCLAGAVLCLAGLEILRHGGQPVAQAQEKSPGVLNLKRLNIVDDEGKVVAHFTQGSLHMGAIHMSAFSLPDKEPYALLSLDSGENVVTLSPTEISMGKRTAAAVRERERFLQRLPGAKNVNREEAAKAFAVPVAISLRVSELGGMFSLKNSLDKEVVSIQANKNNVGAVYISDQNGDTKKSLTGQ